MFISSKNMWEEKDSNEVEVMAILEASQISSYASYNCLIVENNSPKVIPWVSSMTEGSWKSQFHFNKIKYSVLIDLGDVLPCGPFS